MSGEKKFKGLFSHNIFVTGRFYSTLMSLLVINALYFHVLKHSIENVMQHCIMDEYDYYKLSTFNFDNKLYLHSAPGSY